MKHITVGGTHGVFNPSVEWALHELVLVSTDGARKSFVLSDEVAGASIPTLKSVVRSLRHLRAAGAPPDTSRGHPIVELWKDTCPGAHDKTTFWVLKAKPTEWRFYFVPDHKLRTIIFLLAVQKKRDDRNQADFNSLCHRRRLLQETGYCAPLQLRLDG